MMNKTMKTGSQVDLKSKVLEHTYFSDMSIPLLVRGEFFHTFIDDAFCRVGALMMKTEEEAADVQRVRRD